MHDIPSRFQIEIEIEQKNCVAVDILSQQSGLSKQQVKQVMQKGAVWWQSGKRIQRLRRAKKRLAIGDRLYVHYDEKVLAAHPPEPRLVADEGLYSIWDKPSGMLSQGSKWGDHCTITRWAEQHLHPQRNSFIVHRLDRAASGLIIVAHEKKAARALSQLFQQREVEKCYQIWVHGQFDMTATSEQPVCVKADIDGRHAVSYFHTIHYDRTQDRTLLGVSIETGRKHQIRRHVAALGFPVVGDRLYGGKRDESDLQLRAVFLQFHCPFTRREKTFHIDGLPLS